MNIKIKLKITTLENTYNAWNATLFFTLLVKTAGAQPQQFFNVIFPAGV
jgi:hypothetical protein